MGEGSGSAPFVTAPNKRYIRANIERAGVDFMNIKVIIHGEEVSGRLIGLLGGYIRWSGLIDDISQVTMLTERIGGRQLDPESRELIMNVHELR